MVPLQLNLLGGFEARLGTESVIVARRKAQALLAYLALEPEQPHLRDKLAALLWGETTNGQARHSLRQALLAIKRAAPQCEVISLNDTVTLKHTGLDLDVAAFERFIADGGANALAQAARLYRGEFLEGLSVQESRFEDWLMTQRERLRELAVDALAKLLAVHIQRGATDEAVQTATRLLSLDRLQESVHRTLMRLYARQGRRGVALRQYQACVDIMQRELGVEPEARTRALYQEILEEPPPPDSGVVPPVAVALSAVPRTATVAFVADHATPLVGRMTERAALRECWHQACGRNGQVAVVLGDAGIGKTRLVTDFAVEVSSRGGRVLIGRAHESEHILPFGPWVDALRSGHVLAELRGLEEVSGVWMAELARLFPELGAPVRGAHDSEDYGRLFEAITQVLGHLAGRHPLLLIFEDLHWADEMSLRLLAFASRRIAAAPVLLLATARSEDIVDAPLLRRTLAELNRESALRTLPVAPLSEIDTLALVRTLSRVGTNAPTLQRLGGQIWRVSEGNPFMVVETMRALYENEVDATAGELRTPRRVRDVIAARLERLGERGRDLAALASVIGREFDFALLDRAAALNPSAAAEGVEELVARGILHAVGERLDFTHDRIREVAYDQLLAPRRALLHAAVARAIETVHSHDLATHCVALGFHYQRARLWEQAFPYLYQSGVLAAARGAHRQAMTCFEQALEALRHLPDRRDLLEQSVDLRLALRNSCVAVGTIEQIAGHLREAERIAEGLDDRLRLGWVWAYRTSAHFLIGENDQAMDAGRCAVAKAQALAEPKLQIAAQLFFAQTCYAVGEYRQGVDLMQRNVASLEEEVAARGERIPQQIYSRGLMACCLAELGRFTEGRAYGEAAAQIADSAQRGYALAHVYVSLGLIDLRKGDVDHAMPILERGLSLCHEQGAPLLAAALSSLLGYAYALSGNAARALPLITDAVEVMNRRMRGEAHSLIFLGEAQFLDGRISEALTTADHALALTQERGERGRHGWALRLFADASSVTDPAVAQHAYARALAVADELAMIPLRAHCLLGRGRLRQRSGDREGARADLSAAVEILRALDVALWLPAAEAELGQEFQRGGAETRRKNES